MHHPKLFAALFLSLYPAFEVYTIANGVGSGESVGWAFLAFFGFFIMIYGLLALREGVREIRALRVAYERSLSSSEPGRPQLLQFN